MIKRSKNPHSMIKKIHCKIAFVQFVSSQNEIVIPLNVNLQFYSTRCIVLSRPCINMKRFNTVPFPHVTVHVLRSL